MTYLTGGLLYGDEVERPGWFMKNRRRAFVAHRSERSRVADERRAVVRMGLMAGKTYRQLMEELGVNYGRVKHYVMDIRRREPGLGRRGVAGKWAVSR